jgi:hypothetical protein
MRAAMSLRADDRAKIAAVVWVKIRSGFLRSRPGSKPEYRTIASVMIEGIEDLAAIADGVA